MPKDRKKTYSDHQAEKQKKQPKKKTWRKREDFSQAAFRVVKQATER